MVLNKLLGMIDFNEIYRDQGGRHTSVPGYHTFSCYTPEGIRKLDTRYCRRIMAFKQEKTFTEYSYSYSSNPPKQEVERVWKDTIESLSTDIKNDPHLHPTIKENLMFNLNNCE